MTKNFFLPLSFIAVFGSEIRDPGWVKIRIRDKHPGSATLLFCNDFRVKKYLNAFVYSVVRILIRVPVFFTLGFGILDGKIRIRDPG